SRRRGTRPARPEEHRCASASPTAFATLDRTEGRTTMLTNPCFVPRTCACGRRRARSLVALLAVTACLLPAASNAQGGPIERVQEASATTSAGSTTLSLSW